MDFSGTFELDDTTVDEVWLALSDPVMIEQALPGCEFLMEVDTDDPDFAQLRKQADEREDRELTTDPDVIGERAFREGGKYAALMELSVGSVNPSFRTVVTIDDREKPRMDASGEGTASSSSFEMDSGMELKETDDGGVAVDWWSEADVFGKMAQMGQRVITPVANRVVKKFFGDVQDQIEELNLGDEETDAAGAETAAADASDDGSGKSGGILPRIKRLLGLGN